MGGNASRTFNMSDIQIEVLQIFSQFTPGQQRQALEMLHQIQKTTDEPARGSGAALLKHAGRISEEDGLLMERAVEEMCERIDPRDWEIPG
jgi:hypothetical protein